MVRMVGRDKPGHDVVEQELGSLQAQFGREQNRGFSFGSAENENRGRKYPAAIRLRRNFRDGDKMQNSVLLSSEMLT